MAELEKKLKTLEIAGLWNLPPGTDINSIACCMVGSGTLLTHFILHPKFLNLGDFFFLSFFFFFFFLIFDTSLDLYAIDLIHAVAVSE